MHLFNWARYWCHELTVLLHAHPIWKVGGDGGGSNATPLCFVGLKIGFAFDIRAHWAVWHMTSPDVTLDWRQRAGFAGWVSVQLVSQLRHSAQVRSRLPGWAQMEHSHFWWGGAGRTTAVWKDRERAGQINSELGTTWQTIQYTASYWTLLTALWTLKSDHFTAQGTLNTEHSRLNETQATLRYMLETETLHIKLCVYPVSGWWVFQQYNKIRSKFDL